MGIFDSINNFLDGNPQNYPSAEEMEVEWSRFGSTPKMLFDQYAKELWKLMEERNNRPYFDMLRDQDYLDREYHRYEDDLVKRVFSIVLKRYGYTSISNYCAKRGKKKSFLGIGKATLDEHDKIIQRDIECFWNAFYIHFREKYGKELYYETLWAGKDVGKLFERELASGGENTLFHWAQK